MMKCQALFGVKNSSMQPQLTFSDSDHGQRCERYVVLFGLSVTFAPPPIDNPEGSLMAFFPLFTLMSTKISCAGIM
jgi:hypothetical protein